MLDHTDRNFLAWLDIKIAANDEVLIKETKWETSLSSGSILNGQHPPQFCITVVGCDWCVLILHCSVEKLFPLRSADHFLCFLIEGINASGISIPLSMLIVLMHQSRPSTSYYTVRQTWYTIIFEWCIWNKSYVNCGYEIKLRMIPRSYDRNFYNCVKKSEKKLWLQRGPVEDLNFFFFQASLRNCKNCDHNCEVHSSFDYNFYYYCNYHDEESHGFLSINKECRLFNVIMKVSIFLEKYL